jgi:hypothetical protein
MKRWRRHLRKRTAWIASFFLACLAFFMGKKAFEYSLPPDGEKSCDFAFPDDPTFSKPTTLLVTLPTKTLPFEARGGFINDASCLNSTPVFGVVRIQTMEDALGALAFARDNHLKVSVAGRRHSMGGQTFTKDGLALDMRGFNQVSLDRERKIVHAQSGATWAQIQELADQTAFQCKRCNPSTSSQWAVR